MLHRTEPLLTPGSLLRYLDQGYFTEEVCQAREEDFGKERVQKAKAKLRSRYNVYHDKKLYDDVFGESSHMENNKCLLFEVKNGKPYIIVNQIKPHVVPYIKWINQLISLDQVPKNLELTVISAKFRCRFKKGTLKNIKNILGVAQKEGYREIPFLPYYVVEPYWVCRRLKRMTTKEAILRVKKESEKNHDISNKSFFRGSINNDLRKILFEKGDREYLSLDEDGKDFLDSYKFKYLLDINGLDGHSGRRYWMTHMSRMLFIEEHDKHKLFFEGKNGLKRGIHFESFNAKHPEGLYDKISYFEKNEDKYNEIVNNLRAFSKANLTFNGLIKYSSHIFKILEGS